MTHTYRTLSYIVPFLAIIGATAAFAWQLHHPNPCDSFPELRRPSGGELQP
jgi:hypothetical protein